MDPTAASTAVDPLAGRLLDGRYRLTEMIARGGMATVYTATDLRLERTVAVKVMHRALADDPAFVARFTREARAAARLSTGDAVAVHDQGTDPDTGAYLVMEYVDGGTLRDLLEDQGPQPARRALDLMVPVLRALAAAHEAGLVHRDVKPENVLLGRDGRVKVADFGLARAVQASTQTAGLLIGTVAYLAPEQVEHGVADPRSDVYAAGILLFELLTGASPFPGGTPLSVAYRHVHEDVPAPGSLVAGIPVAVDELVVRATRREPAARPADAGVFLAELTAVRDDLPAVPGAPVRRPAVLPARTLIVPRPALVAAPPQHRRGRWRGSRRDPAATALAAIALIAAIAVPAGAWWLGSGRYTEVPKVLGQSRNEAENRLAAAGFDVALSTDTFAEVPAGTVVDQQPDPSGRSVRGSTVTLTLSKGLDLRAVPGTLVGLPQAKAAAALTSIGLRAGPVTGAYSANPAGEVLRTDPVAGTRLRQRTAVALVVSRGIEQLPVPNVTAEPLASAVNRLQDSGFRYSSRAVFSDTVPAGRVIGQTPSAGRAARGSVVALQVSRGPELVAVPDLRGLSRQLATAELDRRGLTALAIDLPDGGGVVVAQSPSAGSRVRKDSRVTFYVL